MNSAPKGKMIAASMIGNVLEWYDFAIYGNFAAAIGRNFFPHEDGVAQVLAAFGVFAIGYLMRPIGGVVIGYIGDYYSRRTAMNVDRKSTRLNSSHTVISYAVFCLKKKKKKI